MKSSLLSFVVLLTACVGQENPAAAPAYVDEAPLPAGWPQPGPYNQVAEKSYPKYRAAFTDNRGESVAFWTLFLHIQRKEIPMTAPVQMPMTDADGKLSQAGMAFLYQNDDVGEKGADGGKVVVKDVPAETVLSYTWQGPDSQANIATARARLDAKLTETKQAAKSFRLLGYNGPGTPREKRTWELQAILR
ncbi:MAG: heme-binding protein [Verrucomicrobiota bacterium]